MKTWPSTIIYELPNLSALREEGKRNQVRDASSAVFSAIGGLAALGPGNGTLWRGHADSSWRLESTAWRKNGQAAGDPYAAELDMIANAKVAGIENSQHLSDLEILARLRHHGAANRLIDVSSDPFTALWFAVKYEPGKDGLLLCFDKGAFVSVEKPWETDYDHIRSSNGDAPSYRFSVGPLDARIAAQRGSFVYTTTPTDQGCSEIPLAKPDSWEGSTATKRLAKVCSGLAWSKSQGRPVEKFPNIVGVLIPMQVKTFLGDVLERAFGMTRASIYPDYAGLGDEYSIEPHL